MARMASAVAGAPRTCSAGFGDVGGGVIGPAHPDIAETSQRHLAFEVGQGDPRGDAQAGQSLQQGVGGWGRFAVEDCIDGRRQLGCGRPRCGVLDPLAATHIRAGEVQQHLRSLAGRVHAQAAQFDVERVGGQVRTQAPAQLVACALTS